MGDGELTRPVPGPRGKEPAFTTTLSWRRFVGVLSRVQEAPFQFQFPRGLCHNGCGVLSNAVAASVETVTWFRFHRRVHHIAFGRSGQPCTPAGKPASPDESPLQALLARGTCIGTLASTFVKDISLRVFLLIAEKIIRGNAGLRKSIGKCSFLF